MTAPADAARLVDLVPAEMREEAHEIAEAINRAVDRLHPLEDRIEAFAARAAEVEGRLLDASDDLRSRAVPRDSLKHAVALLTGMAAINAACQSLARIAAQGAL